jgi:pyruvate formate lyase activating enzyme
MNRGLIFDIKRYAINDGPGIRVVVFFKGCNLQCAWCHNPEGISFNKEKMYSRAKCMMCGECAVVCPEKAIQLTKEGIVTNRELCKLCGKCADVCPTKATEISGYYKTVDELMAIIEKERPFFDQSEGGVTFSGGEPLMHHKILKELLDECGRRKIHRVVDTVALVNSEILLDIAKRTDLFLIDLKMMDDEKHRKWTHVSNKKILENISQLSEIGANIIIRIPIIEGVNDDDENIENSAKFVSGLAGNKKPVNLIPYHNIAQTKYQKLGKTNDFVRMIEPSKETLTKMIEIFKKFGVEASIGG